MKILSKHQSFIKSTIYLLLIGFLWTNIVSQYQLLDQSTSDIIELCGEDEKESSEEESKKDTSDKYFINLKACNFDLKRSDECIIISVLFIAVNHSKITTPPPQG